MGEIVEFSVGCRNCVNLLRLENGTYTCDVRVHMDDSAVYPIVNNKRTSDWNICDGECYESKRTYLRKMRKGV